MNDRRCENWKYNKSLCQQLAVIQKEDQKLRRIFPARALAKGIESLREWTEKNQRDIRPEDFFTPRSGEITEDKIAKSKGKFLIKGIGKGIAKKIYQFIQTGEIEQYRLVKEKALEARLINQGKLKPKTPKEKAIEEIAKISFIGPKKATVLVDAYLKREGKLLTRKLLSKDKKLFGTLTKNQKLMLKYHDQIEKRVPRDFTEMFEKTLKYLTKKVYGSSGYEIVFAGSYRRGHKDSGDIDILIRKDENYKIPAGKEEFTFTSFVNLLREWGVIFETLTSGNTTWKGIGRCPGMPDFVFRLDLLYVKDPQEWIPALVHFTGNKDSNTRLRTAAIKKKMLLSEKGLFKRKYNPQTKKYGAGERVKVYDDSGEESVFSSEKQLFDFLEVPYLKPTQRG